MSRWADLFENHAIHETLKQSCEWASIEIEDIDSDHEAEQRRLIKVIDLMMNVVDGMDPEFFPDAQLTALNNHLRQPNFWNQLNSYSSSGNTQQVKTANDHLNGQISTIYQLAGMSQNPESRAAIAGAEAAYDAFCKTLEKTKVDFVSTADEKAAEITALEARSNALEASLTSLATTTDTQISTWQKEFTEAETKRIQEHADAQLGRSKEYENALDEFKTTSAKDRTETTKKHDAELKKMSDLYANDVKEKTGEINTKHQEILTLHGLVTTDGVAGGYKKGADEEWWAATIWSGISMLCFGIIVLWVIFKGKLGFGITTSTTAASVGEVNPVEVSDANGIIDTLNNVSLSGTDWPLVVATLSITAVALIAAQFAGRQSRVHRMNEQRLRWFSFEIAAIDPFISSLTPDQQKEMKTNLAEKLFGQDRVIEDRPKTGKGIDTEILTNIFEEIKSLRQ